MKGRRIIIGNTLGWIAWSALIAVPGVLLQRFHGPVFVAQLFVGLWLCTGILYAIESYKNFAFLSPALRLLVIAAMLFVGWLARTAFLVLAA
jgi:inner membrane protein involved in colicin E2 resistance